MKKDEHHPHDKPAHSCCHHEHQAEHEVKPSTGSKYYCPMCPGVESDTPGDCPKCGMALERNPLWEAEKKVIYTCPMHPEVERDRPGDCPKCGMPLEPKTVTGETGEDAEVRALSRKFWIALAITVPVVLLAMGHLVPGLDSLVPKRISKWIEFVLTTPVVFWAGGMFFTRAWNSVANRSLNMFTLIVVGVGAVYLFSAVAVIAPGIFPESFRQHGEVGLYREIAW